MTLDPYYSPLWDLGIDEVEHLMCEDTIENRAKLRGAGWFWERVFDSDGGPTGLVKALDPSVVTARRENVWESRKPIMVDPENIYSEYISPLDYPSDYDCPWWIKNAVRQHVGDVHRGVIEEKRTWLPPRCKIVRNDGTRCWNWVSRKRETKCKQHLGWVGDEHAQKLRVAKTRVVEATTAAVDVLEHLMLSDKESGAVRLKASTEILDRAGLRGGTEVDITGSIETVDNAAEVKERLARLAERTAEAEAAREALLKELEPKDVVEGEVVSDEPEE